MKEKIVAAGQKAGKFIKDNGDIICAAGGVIGVTATTILAAKAAPKALAAIELERASKEADLTFWEKVNVAGPDYIPTAVSYSLTCACIIASCVIGRQKQAALVAAYSALSGLFERYKSKMTDEELERIRSEITIEDYDESIALKRGTDEVLFYDEYSGHMFNATMERVLKAEAKLNHIFSVRGYATLNEFYDLIGIGDEVNGGWMGWSMSAGEFLYGYTFIDFQHTEIITDDGLEVYHISYPFAPSDFIEEEDHFGHCYPEE